MCNEKYNSVKFENSKLKTELEHIKKLSPKR